MNTLPSIDPGCDSRFQPAGRVAIMRRAVAARRPVAQSSVIPFPSASNRLESAARMALWWAVGLGFIWSLLMLVAQPVAAQSFTMYIPAISTQGPGASGNEPTECGLNNEELAIAELMVNHPDQGRDEPLCNPILAQVARARARDMALRDYFSHTNLEGEGPNLLVRKAGYPLPDWYADARNANNIESIGAGRSTPSAAWQAWLESPAHSVHVLGTRDFYAQQEAYGIGYYFNPDSRFQHYWVFISAPFPEE